MSSRGAPSSLGTKYSRRGRGLVTRGLDDLLADLAEAVDAASELVNLGKERWDRERPLRLAGEAVIGRLGDIAIKPDEVIEATFDVPWREVKGMRIIAAHAYHRIDYEFGLGHLA
jgi:uncharacterized protein with HEPN domain